MEVHKEPNSIDEADLEDGEIETDEESEIVESPKAPQPAKEKTVSAQVEAKKAKSSSDDKVPSSKKAPSKHSKGEHHPRKSSLKATNKFYYDCGGSQYPKKQSKFICNRQMKFEIPYIYPIYRNSSLLGLTSNSFFFLYPF